MRRCRKRGAKWLVTGPQGGTIAEYDDYACAIFHVWYGYRPDSLAAARKALQQYKRGFLGRRPSSRR